MYSVTANSKSLRRLGEPEPMLYLARSILSKLTTYSLRISFWNIDDKQFHTSKLLDLGSDPASFITYPNDSCFHLAPDFVFDLEKRFGRDVESELEELLWPFVDPSIKRKMEHFFTRGKSFARKRGKGPLFLSCDGQPVHDFDKRRLHYLRFGSTDQGKNFQMPQALECKLLNRSRDELEQYFLEEENRLKEYEIKSYLYAALNLQSSFKEPYARSIPQALPPEQIDEAFLEALCTLNSNKGFWQEREDYSTLHDYLKRYLFLFFDAQFPERKRAFEQAQEFMNGHRQFRWPEKKETFRDKELATLFNKDVESLRRADKKELTRLYRKQAKSLHPDKGGDQKEFIRLTKAYEALLQNINPA